MLLRPFRLKQQMKTQVFSPLWWMSQNALSLLHFNPKQMKGESKRYQSQKPNPKVQRPVPQKQAIQQSFEQLKDEKVSSFKYWQFKFALLGFFALWRVLNISQKSHVFNKDLDVWVFRVSGVGYCFQLLCQPHFSQLLLRIDGFLIWALISCHSSCSVWGRTSRWRKKDFSYKQVWGRGSGSMAEEDYLVFWAHLRSSDLGFSPVRLWIRSSRFLQNPSFSRG